jgi:hypothetical protein
MRFFRFENHFEVRCHFEKATLLSFDAILNLQILTDIFYKSFFSLKAGKMYFRCFAGLFSKIGPQKTAILVSAAIFNSLKNYFQDLSFEKQLK